MRTPENMSVDIKVVREAGVSDPSAENAALPMIGQEKEKEKEGQHFAKSAIAVELQGSFAKMQNKLQRKLDKELHEATYTNTEDGKRILNFDSEKIQALLKQGADPDSKDKQEGNTLLHSAAAVGNTEMVRGLMHLNLGRAFVPNKLKRTPLFCAAAAGQLEIVQIFLNEFSLREHILGMRDKYGNTLAHMAAYGGSRETLEYILSAFPELTEVKNDLNADLLLVAVANGKTVIVDYLFTKYKINPGHPSLCDKSGHTALLVAVIHGQNGMIDHLVTQYAACLVDVNKEGESAAFVAIKFNQLGTLQFLIENYAHDPKSLLNKNGENLLKFAYAQGKIAIGEYLKGKYPSLEKEIQASHFKPGLRHYRASKSSSTLRSARSSGPLSLLSAAASAPVKPSFSARDESAASTALMFSVDSSISRLFPSFSSSISSSFSSSTPSLSSSSASSFLSFSSSNARSDSSHSYPAYPSSASAFYSSYSSLSAPALNSTATFNAVGFHNSSSSDSHSKP